MSPRLTTPLLAAAAIALAACTNNDDTRDIAPAPTPTPTPLSAVIEQPRATNAAAGIFGTPAPGMPLPDTRTAIVADQIPHPIVWSQGDIINIHFDTDSDGTSHVYSLTEGAGTEYGKFEYNDLYGKSGGTTTRSAPPAQYSRLFAGYPGLFISLTPQNTELLLEPSREIFLGLEEVYDFPMIGTGGPDGRISFFCPFGIVHIPVAGSESIEAIYLETSTQQLPISGRFAIDPEDFTTAFVDSPLGNQYSISWNSTSPVQLTDTPLSFYAVVPPATYEAGTTFRFLLESGESIIRTTRMPFTVTRANILNLPEVYVGTNP